MKKITSKVKNEFAVCWPVRSLRWGFISTSFVAAIQAFIMAWPDAVQTVWYAVPYELKVLAPDWLLTAISVTIFVMSGLNRMLKNKELKEK